ncbi:ABC-type sugar transport system, permease component UgpE [Brevinematales bacterium NS]|nr:ABC-type sugar transport system, permease component UgpE [Brevinematales bacterium NS]
MKETRIPLTNKPYHKPSEMFLINAVLVLFVVIWILPTIGLLITSFRKPEAIVSSGWWMAFSRVNEFTLENYRAVLLQGGVGRAFVNSLLISIPSTILVIIIAALAAFPLAFFKFPGRTFLFVLFVSLQVIPLQITLIPVMKMMSSLGISGTFPAIWMAHTAYGLPLAIYIFRNFFAGIPYAIIESAEVDGATKFQIFSQLVIPISMPAVASLGIFQFMWVWNDLLVALVFLGGTPEVAPLTVKIASMKGSLESGWHLMSAAAFVSMVIPLILFLSFQKYFVEGLTAGAVKG